MYLIAIILFITATITTSAREVGILSSILDNVRTPIKIIESNFNLMENQVPNDNERVKIQLYYECLCPDCRNFDTVLFMHVYTKLQKYLDVHTYPYGNAKTIIHGDNIEFECQHGQIECYGNMLHACAIDILNNTDTSIRFNGCLMDVTNSEIGSDDATADMCGKKLSVNVDPIKECAKGDKGKELLKYYGDESHKVKFNYVPYVLINGKEWNPDAGTCFMERICQQFKVAPPPCMNKYYYEINDVK